MRIALLNLPYDNNYGGNLQRYALMKVLQNMGHDVTHLNFRFHYYLPWYKIPYTCTKRVIKKYLLGRDLKIFQEFYTQQEYEKLCAVTEPFYQRYIKHTRPITDIKRLKQSQNYDAYVVGSDQVWRKKMSGRLLPSMFLDFLPTTISAKRIAYGVSLGVKENELSEEEIKQLAELYRRFDAVSVREDSALDLFKQYGWTMPKAIQVLDPTMLLPKDDYINLIKSGNTQPSTGNLFCYILDKSDEKDSVICTKANELGLKPFSLGIHDEKPVSVEQWLRSFNDAEYVITDSFHGLVFSIIFNKPFCLIRNEVRGNARFSSILNMLHLSTQTTEKDYANLQIILEHARQLSINYLDEILKSNKE